MNPTQIAPAFFLAAAVILAACAGVSWVAVRAGQSQVVAQMLTGVLLGPSVLGILWPGSQTLIFPEEIRSLLYWAGQFGLVVFMFRAGHEFVRHRPRGAAKSAVYVSSTGTLVPLALGFTVAEGLGGWAGIFESKVSPLVSAVFVGVTLTITAFPMLANIIQTRGLATTRFGSLTLASGAIDDVVAWILLAGVVAAAAGSAGPVLLAVGGCLVFAALAWTVGRRFLARVMGAGGLDDGRRLVWVMAVLFAAACFTDRIGLYAVFGAFCIGTVMPQAPATNRLMKAVNPLSQQVFLPLFFVYSGLNTRFALLADPRVLLFTLVCTLAAVFGKLGSCWMAGRLAGESREVSARIGVLMNARGLMQLIALNVGLQAGIVGNALFTVLAVVALVTTVMTEPLLALVDRRLPLPQAPAEPAAPPARAAVDAAVPLAG